MLDLDRIRLVAARELKTRLRQRSFIVTTIVQVLFVVIAGCLPVIISAFTDDSDDTSTVLVIDSADADVINRLGPYVGSTTSDDASALVNLEASDVSVDDARAQVDDGDVDAAIFVTRGADEQLAFEYINRDGETDSLAQQMYAGAASISMEDSLTRAGLDQAELSQATSPPAFSLNAAEGNSASGDDDDLSGIEVALAYFFTIIMFMAIMLYGTWIAQGVVEEKSSRIMEIMINAATPRDLLAGKVLGIGAAGLCQLLPMLLAGGLVFGLQHPIARLVGVSTDSLPDVAFGNVSFVAIGWFLVYFLLGFTLYAALYAGLGSLVSRQEEVNQAISPMMSFMFVGYFAAFFTMWTPDSLASQLLSIFPLTSPFVMVSRVIVGDPPAWEMALSVLLLALTMVGAILVAARLYRIGVLLYGQRPSWKALFSRQLSSTAR